jgi:hypothetical protein
MEKRFPHLFEVIKIGTTYEGRDIVLVKISNNVEEADSKPALLYTGTIHAREWIGHELALKFIDYVSKNHNSHPILEKSLQSSTIYMVPCLNPDGYEYSREHFSFWRKNRRRNPDGTIGVDLNRNFSIGWKKVNDTSSNIYGGEKPFSEAETRAIKEFVDSHPNITIALDYHSQGNVFFPAHKFRHEAEIDSTDMNVIAANMNDEIQKVTGRKYGIHRGKPPASLIHGSGREYYYSKGILSLVVEVGTKNIPDYMKVMSGSISENIPALIKTFSEVVNYSPSAPKRVSNFKVQDVSSRSVTLSWDYEMRDDIYFEIYRSTAEKDACNERTLVGVTSESYYIDAQLESSTNYNYTIRAVNKRSLLKSPFAPVVKVRTKLEDDEFFKFIFASQKETGYVAEKLKSNKSHFGNNSLFVGVDKKRGISDGVVTFDLSSLPEDAIIKSARFYIYPMNRVGAKIEKYGEWSLSLLEPNGVRDITNFREIENAPAKTLIGQSIKSQHLTQGIWNYWDFSQRECELLQEEIKNQKAIFRLDGPKSLPDGEDSQVMQFDIGYGKFGGGIHYRPMLDIVYTTKPDILELTPNTISTISKNGIEKGTLKSGFDKDGDKIYGYMSFDLSNLPDFDTTMITECAIKIKSKNRVVKRSDVRFYLELVKVDEVGSYEDIKHRQKIEYIGYEVAESDLRPNEYQFFKFDTLSRKVLDTLHKNNKRLKLVIKPTTALGIKNQITSWSEDVKLVVKYIQKRRYPTNAVKGLKITKEKGIIKLSWNRSEDKDVKGYYVIKNRFHPPKHFQDGVKIYGGKDNFTYDKFGATDIPKYYAVFTYDNVPNFSEPTIIRYEPLERY